MNYCKCHDVLSMKEVVDGLIDEVKEFVEEPSRDEASDIIYCLNRGVGTLLNKPYVRVFPGDKQHVDKINSRMKEYGCIRSKRHLVYGMCPSEAKNKHFITVSCGVIVKSDHPMFGVGLKFNIESGTYMCDIGQTNFTKIGDGW